VPHLKALEALVAWLQLKLVQVGNVSLLSQRFRFEAAKTNNIDGIELYVDMMSLVRRPWRPTLCATRIMLEQGNFRAPQIICAESSMSMIDIANMEFEKRY
jgi:hypothetical protein